MKKFRIAINLFTAIAPVAAWASMFAGRGGVLSAGGFYSLKYFTVLSNLLEGLASLVWLAAVLFGVSGKLRHRAETLKFVACLCVLLTFETVMLFLGPLFGYPAMFVGPNLWLHLIVPLAALAEELILVKERFSLKENAAGVLPVVVYGCFYFGNILVNGRQDAYGWNDFYGFVSWGIPTGILIFALICVVVFLSGLLLRKVQSRGQQDQEPERPSLLR